MYNTLTCPHFRLYSQHHSLSEAEIIDLLNQLNDKNNELEDRIDKLEEDNVRYHLGRGEPQLEDPRFIVTTCPYEICDTINNHYYSLSGIRRICPARWTDRDRKSVV